MFTDSNYSGVVRVKKIIVRGQFQAPSPALLALSNHLLLRPLKATFKILSKAFRGLSKDFRRTLKGLQLLWEFIFTFTRLTAAADGNTSNRVVKPFKKAFEGPCKGLGKAFERPLKGR